MDLFNSHAFDLRVNNLLSNWHVPGLAIAVVQHNTTASKGFGHANLHLSVPTTADTLFDVASTAKSLTAASVALLVDDNEAYPHVQWTTPMSSLLPDDFVMRGTAFTDNVTVEDILSHRSGLPRHDFSYLSPRADTPDSARSVTRNLRNLDVAAPVRSKYMYCNIMVTVATFLVEQMSRLAFADFLHTHFFAPLGMNSTYLQPSAAIAAGLKDRIATPYYWDEEHSTLNPIKLIEMPEGQGAGSIFSTANDFILWVQTIMNQEAPITRSVYDGVTRARIIQNTPGLLDRGIPFASHALYAAGWETFYYRGHEIIYHTGVVNGFGSFLFFLPGQDFGGFAVGNSNWAVDVCVITCLELIFDLIQVPDRERFEFPAWKDVKAARDAQEEKKAKELRRDLCPHVDEAEPQERALAAYVGTYWNMGYHSLKVEVVEGELFVNASDRSTAFTMTFEHICEQKKYVGHMTGWYDGSKAEMGVDFVLQGNEIVSMGLGLEDELDGLIGFKKADSTFSTGQQFALAAEHQDIWSREASNG